MHKATEWRRCIHTDRGPRIRGDAAYACLSPRTTSPHQCSAERSQSPRYSVYYAGAQPFRFLDIYRVVQKKRGHCTFSQISRKLL